MILVSDVQSAIALSDAPIWIADPGSSVPHSIYIDGKIEELIDPPTLPVCASNKPRVI